MLEALIGVLQQARRHVVQKSREAEGRVLLCCRTHPVQPTRRSVTRLGVRSAGDWPEFPSVIGLSSRASAAG